MNFELILKDLKPSQDEIDAVNETSDKVIDFINDLCKEEGIDAVWTDGVLEAIDLALKKNNSIVILSTTSVVAEVKTVVFTNNKLYCTM